MKKELEPQQQQQQAAAKYVSPAMRVINIDGTSIICESPSAQNESYEEGDTEDWF